MRCCATCQAASSAQHGHGGQVQPRRATLPVRGCCWPTLEGPLLLPGMAYRPRANTALHPTSCKSARPRLPSLCLTLANLSSLFLSSAPSWPPFLATFRHPPEHLRSLAFALWPSNSSFSSAAASPQFSATGSTPSHKKADLPGRPPSLCPNLAHARVASPAACQVSGP